MAKYVLAYTGGSMPDSPEEQEKVLGDWMAWFGSLGDAIADPGSPFGPASTISPDGGVSDGGRSGLTGYSIVTADTLSDALSKAKGCPVLASGGSIEVYEAMPIG